MADNSRTLKTIHSKNALILRKTRTTINVDIYYDSCKPVKKAISKRKFELMEHGFLSYILYLGVTILQCCQNIPALLYELFFI